MSNYKDDHIKYKFDPYSSQTQRKRSLVESPLGYHGTHHFHPEKNVIPPAPQPVNVVPANENKPKRFFAGSNAVNIARNRSKSLDESSESSSPPVGSPLSTVTPPMRVPMMPPSTPPVTYDLTQKAFYKSFDFKS